MNIAFAFHKHAWSIFVLDLCSVIRCRSTQKNCD